MAESSGIYAEDIVQNSQGNIGLVVQDAEETTDESDSEDETLKKGQIVVCWYPSGNEETLSLSKVKLADRSLLPGDVLKFADSHRGTQKGFVSNVEVSANVKVLLANQIIHNINCKRLCPLQRFVPSVYVSIGPWLGLITEVYHKVVLRLKNGSRCCLEGEQSSMLYDLSDQRDEDSPFYSAAFYPGQKVAGPAKAFKEVKWLSGTKPILHNQAQIKGTVEEASVIACDVDWQVCGACQHGDTSLQPPESTITQDQLHRLSVVNHFRHANLQIGDKAFYIVSSADLASASGTADSNQSSGTCTDKENAAEIENEDVRNGHACDNHVSDNQTDTGATDRGHEANAGMSKVAGKDVFEATAAAEKTDFNCASVSLTSTSEGCLECSAPENDLKHSSSASVTSVSVSNHSVNSTSEKRGCESTENECDSAQETTNHVDVHDAHDRNPAAGSDSADADEDSDCIEAVIPKVKGASVGATKHDSSSSHAVRFPTKRRKKRLRRKRKAAPTLKVNVSDRVCVEITSTYTTVDVTWQDGSKDKNIPSTDLLPVFHLDDLEFFPGDFVSDKRENADSSVYGAVLNSDQKSRLCNVKWFTREGCELFVERDVSVYDIIEHADFVFSTGDVVVRVAPSKSDSDTEEAGNRKLQPCVGQVSTVDEEGLVFIRWVDNSVSRVKPQDVYKIDTEDDGHPSTDGSTVGSEDDWETASGESTDDELPTEIIEYSSPVTDSNTTGDEGAENADREGLQEARNRLNEVMSNKNPDFMMIETVPHGHAYKNTTFQPENQRRFLSCVRREMALLQTSLPAGIIVRGYEDRMDLMRVMITGPADTPYEHGLFIFDVRLPSDYPASPPVFHYLSQCSGRLNPNLYEDGKVCVSLLGTWAGRGSEMWTSKSNVLQVLISIQGLILCNEPYYNEAGYEKQRGTAEGLENSRLYNEMVLLKLVQSMEKLVTRPPAGLENEILQHFANSGARMIQKLKGWLVDHPTLVRNVARTFRAEESGDDQCSFGELGSKEKESQNDRARDNNSKFTTADCSSVPDTAKFTSKQDKPVLPVENACERAENQGACQSETTAASQVPEFPLFPVSRGFCLSLERSLKRFNMALEKAQLTGFSKKS